MTENRFLYLLFLCVNRKDDIRILCHSFPTQTMYTVFSLVHLVKKGDDKL